MFLLFFFNLRQNEAEMLDCCFVFFKDSVGYIQKRSQFRMNKSTQRVLTSAKVQQTIFCSGHLPKIWLMTDIQLREKEQKLNKKT